ncbi:hypothetical protein B0H63DRAFT_515384 [Podospora didyma]|uniref:Uncharacterized protein n=1 Tax=Podospora didyma TaxID=330526 RepID=A0AAE0K0Y8_9PEZI|nr:hypothetical protein B0H63DRAFT_515384 [Podospora didyma]
MATNGTTPVATTDCLGEHTPRFSVLLRLKPGRLPQPEWTKADGYYRLLSWEDSTFKHLFYTLPHDENACSDFLASGGPCPADIPRVKLNRHYSTQNFMTDPQREGWDKYVFHTGYAMANYDPNRRGLGANREDRRRLDRQFDREENLRRFGAENAMIATNDGFCPRRPQTCSPSDERNGYLLREFEKARDVAEIYAAIHDRGNGITPRLLAYLVETNGFCDRIIGLAVEVVENTRFATPDDADACRAVIEKLHEYGIVYGPSMRCSSFLIVEDKAAAAAGQPK